MNVTFVPGSGRDGAAAWPEQSSERLGGGVRPVFLNSGDLGVPATAVIEALGEEGGHVVAHSSGAVAPTLVVTGGWNALYDEVAETLVEAGARRVVLAGYEHRPQDHEQASRLLLEHWSGSES